MTVICSVVAGPLFCLCNNAHELDCELLEHECSLLRRIAGPYVALEVWYLRR